MAAPKKKVHEKEKEIGSFVYGVCITIILYKFATKIVMHYICILRMPLA